MVTEVLIATASFSLGILAFSSGIWLTIWSLNYSHPKEVRASKVAGYFIIVMAIASLAITCSNLVKAVMYEDKWPKSCERRDFEHGHHKHRFDDMHKMDDASEAKDLSGGANN